MAHPEDYIGRKFGFTRVVWEIRNYCLSSNTTDWWLFSSEFYISGFRSSKWKMSLRRTKLNETYSLRFGLKRLEFGEQQPRVIQPRASVECVLEYTDAIGNPAEMDFLHSFAVNELHEEDLLFAGFAPVNTIHTDVFEIKCEILVYFSDIKENIPSCENIGIKQLSEDLLNRYKNGRFSQNGQAHDMEFKFLNRTITADRSVLFNRVTNDEFRNPILENAEPFHEDEFPYEAVDKVFRYLYTGDLHHAVTSPLIDVFKFAELFDIEPIVIYYEPDEIRINSNIETEEHSTEWTILNFLNVNHNFITTPLITNNTRDTMWRIKVYPKGFGRKGRDVGIFFDINATTPKNICVELFVTREQDGGRVSYIRHKRIYGKEVFGNKEFIEREKAGEFMDNNSLTIGLRLRMAAVGTETNSIGESTSLYQHFSGQLPFIYLSNDILALLNSETFKNMSIKFLRQNLSFFVQDYIIAERCLPLLIAFRTNDMALFDDMNVDVIQQLFHFLYSGEFDDHISVEDFFSLHLIGDHFNFMSLKLVVEEKLSESLNEGNAFTLLNFAIEKEIESLRNFVRNFIDENDLPEENILEE